jgi:hypothetical protein
MLLAAGEEAALKLVGEEEGKLRAAVASGSVRGVARGAKVCARVLHQPDPPPLAPDVPVDNCCPRPPPRHQISGHGYIVSVSWDSGDVVISAHDPVTAQALTVRVPPSRQATLGLPPALLRHANPDAPPSPADWDALFHRLSVLRDTSPPTLVLA